MRKILALVVPLSFLPTLAFAQPESEVEGEASSNVEAEEAEEPELPAGLDDEPDLPSGLGDEPSLPEGLGESTGEESSTAAESTGFSLPFRWSAFIDLRGGARIQEDANERRASLGEARLQLHAERSWETMSLTASLRADAIFDPILEVYEPDLETGDGAIDLREASLAASPLEWMDLKVGRQTLTWGTGDLVFINDMFPKDWNAFIIGRDIVYLKAPSDSVKVSVFSDLANVDLVYTPRFDGDRFPDRRRVSSWDPLQQDLAGRDTPITLSARDSWSEDAEWAARLHRRLGRYELAAYGYRGYWKSPAGFDASTGEATFPVLSVYGASARRALLGGIAHAEGGYYDSRTDRDGDNAFIRNSEVRGLVGFEREAMRNMTLGMQYYLEYMRFHDAYERSQFPGTSLADRARHVVTLRLTYLALSQNLRLSFFAYASPSDRDAAIMPSANYSLSDHLSLSTGAKIFVGEEKHTFFGQLEKNSNAYGALRASW